jgi:hypothetical protein
VVIPEQALCLNLIVSLYNDSLLTTILIGKMISKARKVPILAQLECGGEVRFFLPSVGVGVEPCFGVGYFSKDTSHSEVLCSQDLEDPHHAEEGVIAGDNRASAKP